MEITDPYANSSVFIAEVPSPDPVSNTVGEVDGFPIIFPLVVGATPGMPNVVTPREKTNLNGLRSLHLSCLLLASLICHVELISIMTIDPLVGVGSLFIRSVLSIDLIRLGSEPFEGFTI